MRQRVFDTLLGAVSLYGGMIGTLGAYQRLTEGRYWESLISSITALILFFVFLWTVRKG